MSERKLLIDAAGAALKDTPENRAAEGVSWGIFTEIGHLIRKEPVEPKPKAKRTRKARTNDKAGK